MSDARPPPPIAVVQAACRFPGASSPEAFWKLVSERRSAITKVPDGRWGDGWSYSGGFIEDMRGFDAERFHIPTAEAAVMDPQQRLALTVAGELLDRAGNLGTKRIGVFIGAGQFAYYEAVVSHLRQALPPGTLAGNLISMLAARIAHSFDFKGPAMAIDTACSSSLVAIHLACQSLRAGECQLAIAGGVNLNVAPTVHRMFELAGALSPSGRIRPFSPEADGTVPSDGVGLFLLEPLEQMRAAGRSSFGTILGSAINNCGRTISVMAPGSSGQRDVMRTAISSAGIAPKDVVFVEAHATATPVGDAVERASIARVYPHGPRVGAVKELIGHALGAAGAAGMLRLLGELRPGELGGLNAFGFGGTNAHLVVRGPDTERKEVSPPSPKKPPEHWIDFFGPPDPPAS